ncbi:MAG TPA: VWA domain-containing protein [Acidimicrobiales bacterium]|nr:VWA domain-containing protein [Acidimicrobiales bacterium]
MHTDLHLERNLIAVELDETVHAMLDLSAPVAPATSARRPLDLVAVIDRSGSMAGAPLAAVLAAVDRLIRLLGEDDRLAVVAFDNQVDLVLPLMRHDPRVARRAVARITEGGSTNLSGGWLKGVEILQGGRAEAVRRVLLLTDGRANVGIVDSGQLSTLAAQSAGQGVTTTTIGFGNHFDEDLLRAMADAGHGNARWAEGPDEAAGVFLDEFDGLATIVAQNISVEIRPADAVEVVAVLNDFPSTLVEGGVQVNLGDAYAGESRRLVFAMRIPGLSTMGPATIGELVLRYVEVGSSVALHTVTTPIVVNIVDPDAVDNPDPRVVEEVLVLKAANARRDARAEADRGDHDGAARRLKGTASELRMAAAASPAPARLLEQADALEVAADALDEGVYAAVTSKQLLYDARAVSQSRPTRTKRKGQGDDDTPN